MFKIISQTNDFIVVTKSANVNFHDEGRVGSGLCTALQTQLQNKTGIEKIYPVHRLDKMTSGLILFATNLNSAQLFSSLFENHQIEKYYLAIADKKPSKKQGLIKGDMEKSRRGMYKLMRTQKHPAITQFFSYSLGEGQRLYLLKPHSGKTHQIRVALNSLGAPIMGDSLYNASSKADRGYLHAYALKFNFLGQEYQYCIPPQQGMFFSSNTFKEHIQGLTQPWLLNWPSL